MVYFAAFLSSADSCRGELKPEKPSNYPANRTGPSCGMRANFATDATFSTSDDSSRSVMPRLVPKRVNAISFSRDRTRIFSWPCSMARRLLQYAIFLG